MAFILKVPFQDKEEVKKLGGRWSSERKVWTIPDHMEYIDDFKKWIPYDYGCIVRKPYLIAHSDDECWNCKKKTPMVALGAVNYFFYEFLNVPDADEYLDELGDERGWLKARYVTLFSNVLKMDKPVMDYMEKHHSYYKFTWSHSQKRSTWANTCIHCKKRQSEGTAHEGTGGAFCPDFFLDEPIKIRIAEFKLGYDYHIDGEFGDSIYLEYM